MIDMPICTVHRGKVIPDGFAWKGGSLLNLLCHRQNESMVSQSEHQLKC